MKKIPIFGTSVEGISKNLSAQRRVNCFYEIVQTGEGEQIAIRGTPGLTLFVTLPSFPIRGMIEANQYLYVVAANNVYQVGSTGGYILLGSINTTDTTYSSKTGPVSMAINETQIMIVDGQSGYVMNYNLIDTNAISSVNVSTINTAIANSTYLKELCTLTGNPL